MLRVVLDTTVFCSDFTLSRDSALKLLESARNGNVAIHVSEVVIAETKRRFDEDLRNEGRSLSDKARNFINGRFGSVFEVDIHASVQSAQVAYPELLDGILHGNGVIIEDFPQVSHEEVVRRDLERKLPFRSGKDKPSSGYRDSLIWLTVLDIGSRYKDDQIVFVTANSDDYTDNRRKS